MGQYSLGHPQAEHLRESSWSSWVSQPCEAVVQGQDPQVPDVTTMIMITMTMTTMTMIMTRMTMTMTLKTMTMAMTVRTMTLTMTIL